MEYYGYYSDIESKRVFVPFRPRSYVAHDTTVFVLLLLLLLLKIVKTNFHDYSDYYYFDRREENDVSGWS